MTRKKSINFVQHLYRAIKYKTAVKDEKTKLDKCIKVQQRQQYRELAARAKHCT